MENAEQKNILALTGVRTEPYPTDRFLAKLFLPLIPLWVRPNHLTSLRFIATPFVLYLLWQGNFKWGLPLFILTAFTDALDGAMARVRKQITVWGTIYDPVADKILVGGAVLILIFKIYPWLALAVVVLELLTFCGGLYLKLKGRLSPANTWGKIKMVLQVVAVGFFLLGMLAGGTILFTVSFWIFVLSLLFSVVNIFSRGL